MSATDVAAPPSGPNLQDVTGNSLEEPVTTVPETAPDGRTIGDTEKVKETKLEPQSVESREELKLDIKPETTDTVDNQGPVTSENSKANDMDNFIGHKHKSTAKVTDFKLPDKIEKDSAVVDDMTERSDRVIDIVKQSKLKDHPKNDLGDSQEFPVSRPLTETSLRDGTKFSYEHDRDKRETKSEMDRDTSKSPFSVKVERKPLHTAQTRSHSDYYSKTPSTGRFTHLATSYGQFYGFAAGEYGGKSQMPRMRRPPKLVRLATVTMSARTKPVPRAPSLYYEEPKKPKKVITWDEANEARPPLRIDMEGPGPTQYSPKNRPLNETNAPAWSFGSKCYIEKGGGSRTSWEKTWFQNPEVWTSKVDFYNDSAWPTPTHYRQRPMLGPRQRTTMEAPSFSIGVKRETTFSKKGSSKEPSPVDYDKDVADKIILKTAPSFTHQFRREGTVIWSSKEKSPGPGSYNPNYSYNRHHGPAFSIRSLRREKSHVLGPFSTF